MKIYTCKGKKNLRGEQIRLQRLKKHMTQNDLAAKVQVEGVTQERDSISRIEIRTVFLLTKCGTVNGMVYIYGIVNF